MPGLVQKGQTLALGEWKRVRKTSDSEKGLGALLEETGVRSGCVGWQGAACVLWFMSLGHVSGWGWGAK